MFGKEYPSEMKSYKDSLTGKEVLQLTSKYQNYHIYFTENSFCLGDEEIYFLSSRPREDRDGFNYFHMNLKNGIITQMTDEKDGISDNGHTKTPDGRYLLYITRDQRVLKLLDTKTGETKVLYEENDPDFEIEQPSFSCDQ